MGENYRTVYLSAEGYYEEKRSRFLSGIFHVESEEEAEEKLQEIRRRHYDASHHCYAYTLGTRQELKKASDDGEPRGTAGYPILSVLEGSGLCNTMIVVTRYFGGTLLGTGGLVRAYTAAAKDACDRAVIADKKAADLFELVFDYGSVGRVQYYLSERGLRPKSTEFGSSVRFTVPVPVEESQSFQKKIMDLTNGKATISMPERVYYADILGETVLFDR